MDFPNLVRLSGVLIKCPSCQKNFDQNLIKLHRDVCSVDDSSDGELKPEELPKPDESFIDETAGKKKIPNISRHPSLIINFNLYIYFIRLCRCFALS